MPRRSVKLTVWLLASGYAFLQSMAGNAQKSTPLPAAKSPKEFYENGSLYFPLGTFKKPDGSPDDHHGDVMAWYLRSIGEPPLLTSAENSQAHAYRLIWIAFPGGKTVVIRLQIESDGSGKLFAKETPFDGMNLLLNKEDSASIEAVNGFLEHVKKGDFWELPTQVNPEPRVADGSYWYFEGVSNRDYHMVYRRNPESNPGSFTNIGRYLAKDLAQLGNLVNIPPGDQSEPVRRRMKKP